MDDLLLLTEEPLDETALRAALGAEHDGAVVTFAGTVRRLEGSRALSGIVYQAYESMAHQELTRLLDDAHARWPRFRASVAHRVGFVPVGEASVWIGVAAPHRAEAFEVARFLIDELKARVPIWKKDHVAQSGGRG